MPPLDGSLHRIALDRDTTGQDIDKFLTRAQINTGRQFGLVRGEILSESILFELSDGTWVDTLPHNDNCVAMSVSTSDGARRQLQEHINHFFDWKELPPPNDDSEPTLKDWEIQNS